MARTHKDQKQYLAAIKKIKQALKRKYLREENQRHPHIYPWDEYCPECKSEIFEENYTQVCPTCGWQEDIEDLVSEVAESEAA